MGHRLLGTLPKTQKWRAIVADIAQCAATGDGAPLAAATIDNVSAHFSKMGDDDGVGASFQYLVAFAVAQRANTLREGLDHAGVTSPEGAPTPLALTRSLTVWVEQQQGSLEYAGLAKSAAADALAAWYAAPDNQQPRLFAAASEAEQRWGGLATGAGFSELSRTYFAKLTERYLRYFLDRGASATVKTLTERDAVNKSLADAVHTVSIHAFETAKIAQSFSAGWFNKHTARGMPTKREIRGFLKVAFSKLQAELKREGLR